MSTQTRWSAGPLVLLFTLVAMLGGCALVDDDPLSLERGMTEQEMLEAYADSVVESLGTPPEGRDPLQMAVWNSIINPESLMQIGPYQIASPEEVARYKEGPSYREELNNEVARYKEELK